MRELREKKSSFENTVYEMVIKTAAKEGEAESIVSKHLVTPRQTQFNPGELSALFMIICIHVTRAIISCACHLVSPIL